MKTLNIAGGFYKELCAKPHHAQWFGSGGRAAAALSGHNIHRRLHTYSTASASASLSSVADTFDFDVTESPRSADISFGYEHPMGRPDIFPPLHRLTSESQIVVDGENVLRFGMLEGDAKVSGRRVVYDPQSGGSPARFSENGSNAEELALVLNAREARRLTGQAEIGAAAKSLLADGAGVVVVKDGPNGAFVYRGDQSWRVPAFRTPQVFKIGSGDVFSAFFALNWAIRELAPAEAARLASLAAATYCANSFLPVPETYAESHFAELPHGQFLQPEAHGYHVYLAGPFFTTGELWLINQLKSVFQDLGLRVFSPYHAIGIGDANYVAPADLAGLHLSRIVFACLDGLDPGTIFEVGYATSQGIPVVGLAENVLEGDLKMLVGSGTRVFDDLTTAVYHTLWSLWK